ncbi:MAG: hypothetical protein C0478_15960 [Planctomyces sp.]|nr:hypothetical protein [Planctomyces sp.]
MPGKSRAAWQTGLPIAGVALLVVWMFLFAARTDLDSGTTTHRQPGFDSAAVSASVAGINATWKISPQPLPATQETATADKPPIEFAGRADDLQILRRLHLAMIGMAPSLEEVRAFETLATPDRLSVWTTRLLNDPRTGEYLAQRLGKVFVGIDDGQFIVFRRDRFTQWLAAELLADRPYDQIVRQMIAEKGLWTGRPAGNFITAAVVGEEVDENKLAGRTARAFLGQRMDCAQCHDHFFAEWKQQDFEGLAAYFAPVQISAVGLEDQRDFQYSVDDAKSPEGKRNVALGVPFGKEWVAEQGTERERLAGWVTHTDNRRFDRAIVNRMWGLMFGRPLVEPVDDLPDPSEVPGTDTLDVLARDFLDHGRSLHRLIHVITQSEAFLRDSKHPSAETGEGIDAASESWAMFPLTRLRPEQTIGNMLQAWSLQTIDQNSHVFVRLFRLFRERDFLKEYGDTGEDELALFTGTIPQALLRMNGEFSRQLSEATPLSAPGRLAGLSNTNEELITGVFLACLTRRPTPEELRLIEESWRENPTSKGNLAEDLYWTLFNSPEFSWNH